MLDLALFMHFLVLALFLHFLALALLSIILVRLSPAADFLKLLINAIFVFLFRFPIHRAKFDSPAGKRTGISDAPFYFLTAIQAHA